MSAAYEELQILLSHSKRSISNGDIVQGIETAVTGEGRRRSGQTFSRGVVAPLYQKHKAPSFPCFGEGEKLGRKPGFWIGGGDSLLGPIALACASLSTPLGGVRLVEQGHPECGVELGLHIIKVCKARS